MDERRFIEVQAEDLSGHRGSIEAMIAGGLDGMLIRGMLSGDQARSIAAALGTLDPPLRRSTRRPDGGTPYTVPRTLLASERPDLGDYLEEAAAFRAALPQLLGAWDGVAALQALFLQLSAREEVDVPRDPGGALYAPFTVRTLGPGDYLTVHSGADLLSRPAPAAWLRTFLIPDQQLSFFITLQPPEGGGTLDLYPIRWEQTDGWERIHGLPLTFVAPSLDARIIRPQRGDMILFNGGRIYHSVSPVEGAIPRITLGGFIGFHQRGHRLYHWS